MSHDAYSQPCRDNKRSDRHASAPVSRVAVREAEVTCQGCHGTGHRNKAMLTFHMLPSVSTTQCHHPKLKSPSSPSSLVVGGGEVSVGIWLVAWPKEGVSITT